MSEQPALPPLWQWPRVAGQALHVRRQALRLPPAAGADRGHAKGGAGATLRLVMVGDSIAMGVGVARSEESLVAQTAAALSGLVGRDCEWQRLGRSGAALAEIVSFAQSLEAAALDVIIVSAGVNDVTELTSTRRWQRGLRSLDELVAQRWPGAWLIHLGLPPMHRFPLLPEPLRATLGWRAQRLDAALIRHCASPQRLHVAIEGPVDGADFAADGYHPNATATARWAARLAGRIAPLLQASRPGQAP